MAVIGRIRRRLAIAIVLTALIPVLVAIWLAESAIRQTSERFFMPEVGTRLDQSLELYQELAHAVKSRMRAEAAEIAARSELRQLAQNPVPEAIETELQRAFKTHPSLVSLTVEAGDNVVADVDRGKPLDPKLENRLRVELPLTAAEADDPEGDAAPRLIAVFAAERARFDELETMGQFVNTYKQVASRRRDDEKSYIYALALLLGITILAAVGVGSLFARGVTARIDELAEATQRVGAGDLSVRVSERGTDEITDFARAFNRMLAEVESSRARIEYLQRIGAWQEMARRLAHEIKNPLTPIQLAVQEVHRRYHGDEAEYTKLLDTTLEIVQDEVGTLRRLVTEFSDFARLPQAKLEEADLVEFLTAQRQRLLLRDEEIRDGERESILDLDPGVAVTIELPSGSAGVYLDRQMFRRALINLIRNAVEAVQELGKPEGQVKVGLERAGDYWEVHVDDNGPGLDTALAVAIFDPYVTGKRDGTGLGLAIVKKIVVEHGGAVFAIAGPLGGARFTVRLPALGTAAARALWKASSRQRVDKEREPRPALSA
jgi:nitrogen fixation/metabolism regulation signal transduction histidine kinase